MEIVIIVVIYKVCRLLHILFKKACVEIYHLMTASDYYLNFFPWFEKQKKLFLTGVKPKHSDIESLDHIEVFDAASYKQHISY